MQQRMSYLKGLHLLVPKMQLDNILSLKTVKLVEFSFRILASNWLTQTQTDKINCSKLNCEENAHFLSELIQTKDFMSSNRKFGLCLMGNHTRHLLVDMVVSDPGSQSTVEGRPTHGHAAGGCMRRVFRQSLSA